MKKDILQIVTLCLCIVLLVTVVIQGRRLDEYRMEMENRMQNMENALSNEIQNISWNIDREMEEAARLISDYNLEPAGIDAENRALLAEVSVTLKQWHDDTEVILLADVGGNKQSIPMIHDGNGGFGAEISLPLEGNAEIVLDAQITGGGLTRREAMGAWGDCAMLLPLRSSGGGWSGPEYQDGVLRSSYFSIQIEGQNGEIVTVHNPEFLIYRNGKLAQTIPAVTPLYGEEVGSYWPNNADRSWELECEYGDTVEVYFRCVDEYGLGYEFPFQAWVVDDETDDGYVGSTTMHGAGEVNIFWPE